MHLELLKIDSLHKTFKKHKVSAVDGASFSIFKGEVLGLVGESGCGKTTLGRCLLRLVEPTRGEVYFDGVNVLKLRREELRKCRSKMQIIFQDPYSSLNPRMTVGEIIGEPLRIHGVATSAKKRQLVLEMLDVVGLAQYHISRYPHEFSGGQRQGVGIARSLALRPKLIVCDEAVSALDVSIQSQIINLLEDLQRDFNLTYLFIAHNLSVVKHISDRVGVMYLGKIVEMSSEAKLFKNPRHPYTEALLSAVPIAKPGLNRQRIVLEGDVPSPINPPSGCHFHTRCWLTEDICRQEAPEWREVAPDHWLTCHLR